ncbi:MAG: hypothetical protein IJU40_04725 [Desulfovibrionaceae bacterium]|nr:hypothetical protein [Desulfovibrionaceae bacterium]
MLAKINHNSLKNFKTVLKSKWLGLKKSCINLYVGFLMLLAGVVPPLEAQAGDLSDLFSKITTVSKDAGNAIKVVFFIAGICFVGMGIIKLIQASERHEPKGPGLTYIFLGFLLIGVYSLAKAGSQSLLGVEGGVTLNND